MDAPENTIARAAILLGADSPLPRPKEEHEGEPAVVRTDFGRRRDRQMKPGSTAELEQYFSERTAWRVELDREPSKLLPPYPAQDRKVRSDIGPVLRSTRANKAGEKTAP